MKKNASYLIAFFLMWIVPACLSAKVTPPNLKDDPNGTKFENWLKRTRPSLSATFRADFDYPFYFWGADRDFFEFHLDVSPNKWDLLTYVMYYGNEEQIKKLIAIGADPNQEVVQEYQHSRGGLFKRKSWVKTPLKMALMKQHSLSLWKFLLANGLRAKNPYDDEVYPFKQISWQVVKLWEEQGFDWRKWFYDAYQLKSPRFFASTGFQDLEDLFDIKRLSNENEVAAYFALFKEKSRLLPFNRRELKQFSETRLSGNVWATYVSVFARLPKMLQRSLYQGFLADKQQLILKQSQPFPMSNSRFLPCLKAIDSLKDEVLDAIPDLDEQSAPVSANSHRNIPPSDINSEIPVLAEDPDAKKFDLWLQINPLRSSAFFYAPFDFSFDYRYQQSAFNIPGHVAIDFLQNMRKKLYTESKWNVVTYVLWYGNKNQILRLLESDIDLNEEVEQKISYDFSSALGNYCYIRKSAFKIALIRHFDLDLWRALLKKGMRPPKSLGTDEKIPFNAVSWQVIAYLRQKNFPVDTWFYNSHLLASAPFIAYTGNPSSEMVFPIERLTDAAEIKSYMSDSESKELKLKATKAALIPELYEVFYDTYMKLFPGDFWDFGANLELLPAVKTPKSTALPAFKISRYELFEDTLPDYLNAYFAKNSQARFTSEVEIQGIEIHKEELELLAHHFPHLTELSLVSTQTQDDDLTDLKEKFPKLSGLAIKALPDVTYGCMERLRRIPGLNLTVMLTKAPDI